MMFGTGSKFTQIHSPLWDDVGGKVLFTLITTQQAGIYPKSFSCLAVLLTCTT